MDTDVIIAGAGPTGLLLAGELRLAGIDVILIDRLPGRSGQSRAGGIHARSMEILDQRGMLEPFLAGGIPIQAGHFAGLPLDTSTLATRYPYTLNILQGAIEQLLEQHVEALGSTVRWSHELVDLGPLTDGVEAGVYGPGGTERLRARYLVGCDGGRSSVRKLANIDFDGTPATLTALLGDVELTDPPDEQIFMRRCPGGDYSVLGFRDGWYRVMTTVYDRATDPDEPATLDTLRESLCDIAGTDFGIRNPQWVSRFADAARQADRYRVGPVLLAGDAAHVHMPFGGQGLNTGVQDAMNLGWKLAAVVRGDAPDTLLDSYHHERHPVGARVVHNSRAQTALARPGPHNDALRDIMRGLLATPAGNESIAAMITALDVSYPAGDGHPLLGRRMPDVDLTTDDGPAPAYRLLHGGRPVLLDLGAGVTADDLSGWADRVDLVSARCAATRWAVPVLGEVAAPGALLIRPDGHVAWAAPTTGTDATGLHQALTTWCGPARDRAHAELS